jgi:MFS transporter, ACS family, tartrate transporter
MSQTTTPAGRELETSTIRAIGWVKEATDSTSTGLLVLAVLPLFGGLLVFLGGHETKVEFAAAGQAK